MLDKVEHYLSKQKYTWEVVIVDDGSSDESVEFVEKFVKDAPRFRLLKESHSGKAGAVTINYGIFINAVIGFSIVAFSVFLIIKAFNNLKKKEEIPASVPATKDCPYCFSTIPIKATKCGHCTSLLSN